MKKKHSGFTLAELLIVVAIIGVLVAISIPIFTSQLEKSRESTDLANVRGMYAEVMAAAITEDSTAVHNGEPIHQGDDYVAVLSPISQKDPEWHVSNGHPTIGGVSENDHVHWSGTPEAGGSCTLRYSPAEDAVYINWSGSSDSSGGAAGGTAPGDSTPETIAHAQNEKFADEIGDKVLGILHHAVKVSQNHGGNGSHVTVTIYKNRDFTINDPNNKLSDDTKSAIRNQITSMLFENPLNQDDPAEGYSISFNLNSGNGGKKEYEVKEINH